MTPAASMTLTCTVVHAPGSVPESVWDLMRVAAGGTHPHELRIIIESAAAPSGAQLADALSAWIQRVRTVHSSRAPFLTTATRPTWAAVLDDMPLKDHTADSSSIHQGMVVVLHPRARAAQRARSAPSTLRLCVSAGPDSGWLVRVARGVHVLGRGTRHRGTADIRINDHTLDRRHASIHVSSTQVRLTRAGTAAQLLSIDAPVAVGRSQVELVEKPPSPSPWTVWPVPPVEVAEQSPPGRHRTMLLMSLAPLIVGIVLVVVTGMWIFLLFSALSAVIAVITLIDGHRHRRRFRRAVRTASTAWAQRRSALLPPPGRAIRALRARTRPRSSSSAIDGGGVVVTVGQAWMDAEWDCPGDSGAHTDLPELSVSTAAALPLRGAERTSLSGPPREQLSVLRWILAQLTHHFKAAPDVLLAAGPGEDGGALSSDFVDPGELRDYPSVHVVHRNSLLTALHARQPRPAPAPDPVLISPVPLDSAQVRAALEAGWHVISPTESGLGPLPTLPPSQRALSTTADGYQLNLESGELHRIEAGAGRKVAAGLIPDGLSRQTLHEHLRLGLPHGSGMTAEASVPAQFTTSLPAPLMTHSARRRLETLVGRGAAGEELLDLVEDGPHILLAGTTGAGKSELLKSMLLGWAARYSPSELNLLLFDFKGGSSFQHLARLEHTLGLVTDLTQAQSDRALEGIRSELTRRERLFLECGATDYADFRRSRPDEPLARVLVVIDEFRIFTQELPGAMGELMRLATLGRSLGLHLILATQRPQGVVTAEIRANIGATICLRQRSDDEARELVGTTEPARIPRQLPGRGIIQRPGDSPVPFHAVQLLDSSARLTARPERAPVPPKAVWEETTPQLVGVLAAHMRGKRIHRPHTPLCPPLPEILRAPPAGDEILVGLIDDPTHQTQRPLCLDLDEGVGTALLGEAGSGITAALQSLVGQLLARPDEVHVYLLDGDHSLEQFRSHPRVGSWVTTEHPQDAQHLVSLMHRLVVRRRTAPPQERIPLVLVLSGHPQWHGLSHLLGLGGLEHDLGVLIGEGAGFGVSAVVAGGRELALGKLGSRLPSRIYVPYGVSEDVRLLWPKLRVTDRLLGRGVLVTADVPPPGLTVQLVTGIRAQPPRSQAIGGEESTNGPMLRVHPLPEAIDLPVLKPRSEALLLGLRQFTHSPALLEDDSWQVGLILGAAQTGKTNALRVVAAQRGCWTLGDLSKTCEHGVTEDAAPRLLLVDDADRCTPAQHRSIEAWLDSGEKVLATARPNFNVFGQLPWSYRARGGSANFVLSPLSRSQGDAFGSSIPILPRLIPGRAVWMASEGPRVLQWWRHPGTPCADKINAQEITR